MTDRDKVIKGLERCSQGAIGCHGCIYKRDLGCRTHLAIDALALLKEQQKRIETLESLRRIEQEGR